MRRREFIGLAGAAAAWPLAAHAPGPHEARRRADECRPNHAEGKSRLAAFRQALQDLGWADGRNVRIETRGAAGVADNYRKYAAE